MTADDLRALLRRHVGHQLRCVREVVTLERLTVETIALRCDDCGEVVIETFKRDLTATTIRRLGSTGPVR